MKFSICVLLYGDTERCRQLHQRCLGSINARIAGGREHICDLRIGMNEVAPQSRHLVSLLATGWQVNYNLRTIIYECPKNAFKYPLMRKMILEEPIPPGDLIMWFDDDSSMVFLPHDKGWWLRVLAAAAEGDIVGQRWERAMQGNQWLWIQRQPWYNPAAGPPPVSRKHKTPIFVYCQGGWWVTRTELLQRLDWPLKALRHCGGDSLLGEVMRQQGLSRVEFDEGLWINADDQGRKSQEPRRGQDEPLLAKHYQPGDVMDESHQQFQMTRTVHMQIGPPDEHPNRTN